MSVAHRDYRCDARASDGDDPGYLRDEVDGVSKIAVCCARTEFVTGEFRTAAEEEEKEKMIGHVTENLTDEELEARLRAFGYLGLADSLQRARLLKEAERVVDWVADQHEKLRKKK